MKLNKAKQLILGVFAAVLIMSGALTITAEAQNRGVNKPRRVPKRVFVYRPYYRYYSPFYHPFSDPFWGSYWGPTYRVVDPIAYQREQGYREGRDEGKDDAKEGRPANPTGHKDYLKSNSLAFREAFVQGYDERYREEIAKIQEKAREKHGE
jgi:hypothetical protein